MAARLQLLGMKHSLSFYLIYGQLVYALSYQNFRDNSAQAINAAY